MDRLISPPPPARSIPFCLHATSSEAYGLRILLDRAADCSGTPLAGRANDAACGQKARPGTAVPVVCHATAVAGENAQTLTLPAVLRRCLLTLQVARMPANALPRRHAPGFDTDQPPRLIHRRLQVLRAVLPKIAP